MLIDSHCHLDRVDLKPYGGDFKRGKGDLPAFFARYAVEMSDVPEAQQAIRDARRTA